jgi:threonine dehydratase
MYEALRLNKVITLDKIDTFVDGAALRRTSQRTMVIINFIL